MDLDPRAGQRFKFCSPPQQGDDHRAYRLAQFLTGPPAGEVWRESREAENRKAPAQTESAYSAAARCGCGRPFIYRTLTGWLV
ncbi:MAG TPA: hypothetical protein VL614_16025, partial [Acetobacteraceae bacterium]|nr:hypothetical protein [Acetobacteraceae bacterium]